MVVRGHRPGIQPEDLEHIFDRYFSTGRTQGTGLGLSVALENARLLHETIMPDVMMTEGQCVSSGTRQDVTQEMLVEEQRPTSDER